MYDGRALIWLRIGTNNGIFNSGDKISGYIDAGNS
jgi:hypothetical protein